MMENLSVDNWRVYACGENRKLVGQNQGENGGTVVSDMFHRDQSPESFRLREEDLSVLVSRLEEGSYEFLSIEPAEKFPIVLDEKEPPVAYWLTRSVDPQERLDILDKVEALCVDFGDEREPGVFFQAGSTSMKYGDGFQYGELNSSLEGAGQLSLGDEKLLVAFAHFNQVCPSSPFVSLAAESGIETELGSTYSSLKEAAGKFGFDLKKIRALAESSRLVEPLVNLAELNRSADESHFF